MFLGPGSLPDPFLSQTFHPYMQMNSSQFQESHPLSTYPNHMSLKNNFTKPPTLGPSTSPYIKTVAKWIQDLDADWLDFEVKGDVVVKLFCKVCKEYSLQKGSPYVNGTKNVHKTSVIFHMKSDAHATAMRIKKNSTTIQKPL